MRTVSTSLLLGLLAAGCSRGALPSTGSDGSAGTVAPPLDPLVSDEPAPPLEGSVASTLSDAELSAPEDSAIDIQALTAPGAAVRYRARFVAGYPGLLEFKVGNTGSGWQEKFLLQLPPQMPSAPAPLLVVFHKYGVSHSDVLNTTFREETQQRGWYLLAPLGAHQRHFGAIESQINTRAALDLVARLFPIDSRRVYGVGFSMGGGALANYAARHQDPGELRFAAICQHTGGVSLEHTWFWEPDDDDSDDNVPTVGANLEPRDVLETLFGGLPTTAAFNYRRCSSVTVDNFTAQVAPGANFARNLAHVPVLSWVANTDPLAYLTTQAYAFHGHIQPANPAHRLRVVHGATHSWSTLDETYVCDWLAGFQLATPTSGSLVADEDGVWFQFQVEQDVAGAFSTFDWSVEPASGLVTIANTSNVDRLTLDLEPLGLSMSGPITVRRSATDGTGDHVRLLKAPGAPTQVLRDGVPMSATYDPLTASLTISEPDAGLHDWVVTFP